MYTHHHHQQHTGWADNNNTQTHWGRGRQQPNNNNNKYTPPMGVYIYKAHTSVSECVLSPHCQPALAAQPGITVNDIPHSGASAQHTVPRAKDDRQQQQHTHTCNADYTHNLCPEKKCTHLASSWCTACLHTCVVLVPVSARANISPQKQPAFVGCFRQG